MGDFAVLFVDDSVLENALANELVCTHWGHGQQRYVKSLNFVSLLYQAGDVALPIAIELVGKTVAVCNVKAEQLSARRRSRLHRLVGSRRLTRLMLGRWLQFQADARNTR